MFNVRNSVIDFVLLHPQFDNFIHKLSFILSLIKCLQRVATIKSEPLQYFQKFQIFKYQDFD